MNGIVLNRKFIAIALSLLLVIALPIFIFIAQKNQENRSHANAGTSFSLGVISDPAKPTITVTDRVNLLFTINPGSTNLISIVRFAITYDKTKLTPVSPNPFSFTVPNNPAFPMSGPTPPPPVQQQSWREINPVTVDSINGVITGTYTVGSDPLQSIQKQVTFGIVSFTAIAGTEGQTTSVGFSSSTAAFSVGSSDTASENVLANTTPAQFSITSSATPTVVPTQITHPVCLEVITYAVNDTSGVCQEYSSSCIPVGWHTVDSCPVTPTTTQPTPQPTIVSPTIAPTVVPESTYISLSVALHGIGYAGDNANPGRPVLFDASNPAPSTTPRLPTTQTRVASLQFYDNENNLLYTIPTTLTYSLDSFTFKNKILLSSDAATILTGKPISLRISTPKYLTTSIPYLVITKDRTTLVPYTVMVGGNIYNDATNINQLDILDYNAIMDCREDVDTQYKSGTCNADADANDDGKVDFIDYQLLIRELSVQAGQ